MKLYPFALIFTFSCLNFFIYAQSDLLIEGNANQGLQVTNTANADVGHLTSSKLDITSSLFQGGINFYQTNKGNTSWFLLQNDPNNAGPALRLSLNGDNGLFNPGDAELEVNAGNGNIGGDLNLRVSGKVGLNKENPSTDFHIKQSADNIGGGLRLERSTFGDGNYWEIQTYSDNDLAFEYNGILKAYLDQTTGANLITSDRRLKKDISEMPSILNKINQLMPVSYHYLEQSSEEPEVFGFVAQDIEKIFPNLVDNKKGFKGLNISAFGVLAIKGIQEQQLLIEDNDQKIKDLLVENIDLKTRLAQLEAIMAKILAQK